jgi:hypothetical protein
MDEPADVARLREPELGAVRKTPITASSHPGRMSR